MEQKQTSGAFGGSFAMGMIAGLVASPCTSATLGAVDSVERSRQGNLKRRQQHGIDSTWRAATLITLFAQNLQNQANTDEYRKQTFGFAMLALLCAFTFSFCLKYGTSLMG